MSFNGSGTFNINSPGQPVVTNTVISSTSFNQLTADLATGLSTAITKDGQTTPTANIPLGGYKVTGLGNGTAAADAVNYLQLQTQVQNAIGTYLTVTGTDTILGSTSPALTAYTAGQTFSFVAAGTNTGAVTINIDSVGVKTISTTASTDLTAGDMVSGQIYTIIYNGTRFQLTNPAAKNTVSIQTASFAAAANLTYAINSTSGAITATLPAAPNANDYITFIDYARTFGTYALTLNPNGKKINASTSNVVLSISGEAVSLIYVDSTQGWLCYSGFTNNPTAPYTIEYGIVAGGGGSSYGAGGAGGAITSSATVSVGTAYTITVGLGGAAGTPGSSSGTNGNASAIVTLATTVGGGGGAGLTAGNGVAGGSGGSGFTTGTGGAGTAGQGYAGGNGAANASGGGGGGGAVGANAVSDIGGAGGAGVAISISGAAVTLAGGGGGRSNGANAGGAAGSGGGGAGGGNNNSYVGAAGTVNTGGGAGGGNTAAAGGAGIVALRYLGTQRGTGGTITSSGGYTIHTFLTSSTYNA